MRAHAPVITRTHAHALQRARAQRRDRRRQPRARRSAHGPAAGADRARRAVSVAGPSAGERTIPVENLFAGYYETVLARDELITELIVPAQGARAPPISSARRAPCRRLAGARRCGRRSSAMATTMRDARVVISAATETADPPRGAEQVLRGGRSRRRAARARRAKRPPTRRSCITDVRRARPRYKKQLVRVYVARARARGARGHSGAGH